MYRVVSRYRRSDRPREDSTPGQVWVPGLIATEKVDETMASPEFHKLTAYMAANPMPKVGRDEMRRNMAAYGANAKLPEDVTVETPAGAPVRSRLLRPADARPGLVLFAHGGGFTLGSVDSHGHVAAWLARAVKRPVVIFDYRLAPEHPFPAALDDYRAMFNWAMDQSGTPARIGLAGDSAGANLSLSLVANGDVPRPAAIAALSPSTDLAGYLALDPDAIADKSVDAGSIAEGFRLYLGTAPADHPRASPNFADLSGLPPTLMQLAEGEVFAPGALDFAARAKATGAQVEVDIWPEMMHDWHWFAPRLPEARAALDQAGAFLARHLA
jgi:monoterpene epsilon-lactone hydrolase